MMDNLILTYQTRPRLDESTNEILQECATLLNKVERSLYAQVATGKTAASCKNAFLNKYGITARQFNACRVSLEGRIAACREGQKLALVSLKERISLLEKQIQRLEKKTSKNSSLHHKKRRKISLSHRLLTLEKDCNERRVHLCFGGKKLFRAQFHLEKNGFSKPQEWKKAWQHKRNSEFFALGSKDETAGNQTCTARIKLDGSLTLRLRLPPALESKYGKHIEIENVNFAHGHQAILASLNDPEGQALSYRFKVDNKGWRIFVSTALKKAEIVSREERGVIGIDLNADHIALIETDRFGNPVEKKVIPWNSYGKTKGQFRAITGDICKEVIDWAKETKKPLVIEELDFQKKKQTLKDNKDKFARLLSSFAYGQFFDFLNARAFKHGIIVHKVNPAFTSVIGRVNYAKRYGLSIHLAAALCIARRKQKFSEAPCSSEGKISDGKGSHLAFVLPVRNRTKHVWHFWSQVKKKLKTVLAAHFRAKRHRSSGPPNSILVI